MTAEKDTAGKSAEKATAAKTGVETAAQPPRDETEKSAKHAGEETSAPTLTEVQPPGAVSEVVTGTVERPESTRIVTNDEAPVSARDVDPRPAEYREKSQVAPSQVAGEQGLHGNADY